VNQLVLLFDVRTDPVGGLPWGALIVLLVIVFVLAVGFVGGIVAILIWYKRRKEKQVAALAE
jgi:Flp pilus assembly protein protease CpaA